MGYSEALEKQAAMLAYLRSPAARRAIAEAKAILRECGRADPRLHTLSPSAL